MFKPIQMGTNHMLGENGYVPLTTNNFEVRVYNMDGSSPTEFSDLLTLSTDEIGSISEDQDIITVHYGNSMIKFPSKVNIRDVEWTLNCFCSPSVLKDLRAWREKVYDPVSEKMGLPTDYMKIAYFIKYDGQGNQKDVIKCPGTWISALDNGAMNQQGGDIVKVKVTFVISKAIYLNNQNIVSLGL